MQKLITLYIYKVNILNSFSTDLIYRSKIFQSFNYNKRSSELKVDKILKIKLIDDLIIFKKLIEYV